MCYMFSIAVPNSDLRDFHNSKIGPQLLYNCVAYVMPLDCLKYNMNAK